MAERLQTHIDGETRDMTPEEEAEHLARQANAPPAWEPQPPPTVEQLVFDALVKGGVISQKQADTLLAEAECTVK